METTRNTLPSWRERLNEGTSAFIPGTTAERSCMSALLLLALVLRFWGFPSIPYTHDEISGLLRVDHPTIGSAIASGSWKVDAHPPGVHFFLLFWTHWFGFGDGAVKAPFIVASVLALFYLYRFAYSWAGGPVALITTALLATMQYTVMYGQIARPYAMGFLTTALLADGLTRYLATSRRHHLVTGAIAALMCALVHHFALLSAALMCTTAIVLATSAQRRSLLIALAVPAALYLPVVPLLLHQLGIGGLDNWLDPPGPRWTLDYAWWIGHCSVWFTTVISLLIAGAAALRLKQRAPSGALWGITLTWGLLPLIIGYAYSVLRSPVLQYSVLLFSFPYLLIGILAGLRHLRSFQAIGVSVIVAVVAVFTLVKDRQHYSVFYKSKYEDIVRGTIDVEADGGLAVVDLPEEVVGFYRRLWCVRPSQAPYLNLRGKPVGALDSALANTSAGTVFYGQITSAEPENVAKVQARFPFLIARQDRYEGQTFRFTARPHDGTIKDTFGEHTKSPEVLEGDGWEVDPKIQLTSDTSAIGYGGLAPKEWDFTGHEYGAVYDGPIYELAKGDNDVIEVRADLASVDPASDLLLVVELKEGDITRFYRATRTSDALRMPHSISLITAMKLADIPGHGAGLRLRTYLYNKSRRPARITGLRLSVREGDPVLYGLFQPIDAPWRFK